MTVAGGERVREAADVAGRPLNEVCLYLVDTLTEDFDLSAQLDRLVHACVRLLDVSAAAVMLVDPRGSVVVPASTDEAFRRLMLSQVKHQQGLGLECLQTGALVSSDDLADDVSRWPSFAPAALSVGFRAATVVPMRLRDQTIGALHLFTNRPTPLGAQRLHAAESMAKAATIGIVHQRLAEQSAVLTGQLQHALTSRIGVEQAKGVLASRHGIDLETAFEMMRRAARNSNRKLIEIAREVTSAHDQLAGRVAPAPRPALHRANGAGRGW
jgi:GAF domain-containing protein